MEMNNEEILVKMTKSISMIECGFNALRICIFFWSIIWKLENTEKIWGKTATTSKGDVIYPKKKKEKISSCRNIGRRFCTRAFKLCFCTEIGALPKLSRLNKAQPSKGKIPNWLHFSILLFASKQRHVKDCKEVLRTSLPGRSLASRRSLCQSPCSPGSRGSPRLEFWFKIGIESKLEIDKLPPLSRQDLVANRYNFFNLDFSRAVCKVDRDRIGIGLSSPSSVSSFFSICPDTWDSRRCVGLWIHLFTIFTGLAFSFPDLNRKHCVMYTQSDSDSHSLL